MQEGERIGPWSGIRHENTSLIQGAELCNGGPRWVLWDYAGIGVHRADVVWSRTIMLVISSSKVGVWALLVF